MLTVTLFAQHKINFDNIIKGKILNNNTGVLLIKTSTSIYGISPKEQKIIWTQKIPKQLDFSSYLEIPFTPLIIFDRTPLINSSLLSNTLGVKGKSRTIINVDNGVIMFDSEAKGYKAINNTLLISEKKAIFVEGIKDENLVIGLYNYENGDKIWEQSIERTNFLKTTKSDLLGNEKIALDINNDIIWLKGKTLLKINTDTGSIDYKHEEVTTFEMNEEGSIIYTFLNQIKLEKLRNETSITALSVHTSKTVWDNELTILGDIQQTVLDSKNLIVITSKGFDVINSITGKKKWDKLNPLPLIKKIVPVKNGYLVAQDKFLTHIDTTGKSTWEKSIKISLSSQENPVHIIDNDQSAIYITPSMVNKINITTGKKEWKDVILNDADFVTRNLKLKEHPYKIWYDKKHNQFPVYTDNSFYIFNLQTQEAPSPLSEFDFGNELPYLNIRENGYFLSFNTTFYLFDNSGKLVYKKEFPSHHNSSLLTESMYWAKRGLQTYTAAIGLATNQLNQIYKSILVSQDISVLSKVTSGIYGSYQSYQNSLKSHTKLNKVKFSSSLQTIFNRIKKKQDNDDYIILVISDKDQTKKIIRLHMDTGQVDDIKHIKENQSDFIIDQIEGILYFFNQKDVTIEQLSIN
ncbi:PQQ-binding-like beta-propeller repeat protein [Aquimarina longa]|uniref:PQQ-binding-like beta-propeller repeat protein n=1 Tax=Aquimarina longa TaxID=1080221 RepID=UPI00078345C4|nr:PQQ-binding-like beta-propeller repeat protein [Aquimarina longa]